MILKVLGWFFGVSFVFGGIGMLTEGDTIAGLLLLLASVFCLPPLLAKMNAGIKKQDEEKGKAHTELTQGKAIIASLVILVIAAFFATPVEKEEVVATATDTIHEISEGKIKTQDYPSWYEKGNSSLIEKRVSEWGKATYKQQVSVCAEYIAALKQEGNLNSKLTATISNQDDLKPFAEGLAKNMSVVIADKAGDSNFNPVVGELMAELLVQAEWIETEKKVKAKGEWYTHDINISYGEMNGTNWVSYTSDQKLAISANILAHFWTEETLSPNIKNSIKKMDDLKPYAKELVVALDEFYIGGDQQLTANQSLSQTAVMLLTLMKWI
ncbi:hypothetical protein NDQ71_00275 [Pseudoalteromonas sp. KG3]|uniref:hypothetical protein n=1 Tax=Pseudoalteromonas sp. KG3 TaxID=2951137 RepID=UPI0026597B13|nr:hypothetical protein [Pseudoalteromonas sp. KG3]WKD23582.1 hypothetical protein NDQ71_00275 [Pseudoalteromonas sp. KG3]